MIGGINQNQDQTFEIRCVGSSRHKSSMCALWGNIT